MAMDAAEDICDICGNEIFRPASSCPYCGSQLENGSQQKKVFLHRVVNLEEGRPLLETALGKMECAIVSASGGGITVLTLIHGYGSSGRGGVIRRECRKVLDFMAAKGTICGYLIGEEFYNCHPLAKMWIQRYPKLADNSHFNRKNPGITLVFL